MGQQCLTGWAAVPEIIYCNNIVPCFGYRWLHHLLSEPRVPPKKCCSNKCILVYFAYMIKENLSITTSCMKPLSNQNSWDLNPQRASVAFLMSAQIHRAAFPCNTVWRIGEVDHHMTLNPTKLAHLQRLIPGKNLLNCDKDLRPLWPLMSSCK